jgi:hypothetical protein
VPARLELVPPEAVDDEEDHAVGVPSGRRQPVGCVIEVQERGHHVRDARTAIGGEEGVVGHGRRRASRM